MSSTDQCFKGFWDKDEEQTKAEHIVSITITSKLIKLLSQLNIVSIDLKNQII